MAYRLCTSLPSWLEGFDPPYPLHITHVVEFPSGQRGQTVNLLARLSMVRIHLPPPFLTSERQQSLPFFTIYAFNSRNLSYIKSNQSVGSKLWGSEKWIQIFTASNLKQVQVTKPANAAISISVTRSKVNANASLAKYLLRSDTAATGKSKQITDLFRACLGTGLLTALGSVFVTVTLLYSRTF